MRVLRIVYDACNSYSIPVFCEIVLIFARIFYTKAGPQVTVLHKVEGTPLAEAQERTRGLDREAAAHMG